MNEILLFVLLFLFTVCTFFFITTIKTHFFSFCFIKHYLFLITIFSKIIAKSIALFVFLYLYLHVSNLFVCFLAPNGCHTVAVMYKKGDGVTQDERKFKYYRDLTLEIVKATGATVGTKTSTVSGM